MLDSCIIQHNTSPFASFVVLVKKKDSWRLYVNYRDLNKLTIKDKFSIPIVEVLLEELMELLYPLRFLRSGYHHIKIICKDMYKITVRTHNSYYEFLVMPFGLINAFAIF